MTEDELTPRHEEILQYIKQKPGCSIQNVIDYMDHNSRKDGTTHSAIPAAPMTTRNCIDDLAKLHRINIRGYPGRGAVKELYFNDKSAYNKIIEEITDFEHIFFRFWSALDKQVKHAKKVKTDDDLLQLLVFGSRYFVVFTNLIRYKAIGEWPQIIPDIDERKKVLGVVFNRLANMYIRLQTYYIGNMIAAEREKIQSDYSLTFKNTELSLTKKMSELSANLGVHQETMELIHKLDGLFPDSIKS